MYYGRMYIHICMYIRPSLGPSDFKILVLQMFQLLSEMLGLFNGEWF